MAPQIVNVASDSPLSSSLAASRQIASSTHVSLSGDSFVANRLVIRECSDSRLLVSADIEATDGTVVIYGALVSDESRVAPELHRIAKQFDFPVWALDHSLMQFRNGRRAVK